MLLIIKSTVFFFLQITIICTLWGDNWKLYYCIWPVTLVLLQSKSDSPEVFISYQWGKQPQVQILYQRLTSLGFTCWLDIMQMGGGDSLFDKIDRGVRGCKVVLSCVTSKYSISANCRREVSLADAIKKPIIPILLEKISWPPEGPMSMVFTQLLYIDFCKPNIDVQVNISWYSVQAIINKYM